MYEANIVTTYTELEQSTRNLTEVMNAVITTFLAAGNLGNHNV